MFATSARLPRFPRELLKFPRDDWLDTRADCRTEPNPDAMLNRGPQSHPMFITHAALNASQAWPNVDQVGFKLAVADKAKQFVHFMRLNRDKWSRPLTLNEWQLQTDQFIRLSHDLALTAMNHSKRTFPLPSESELHSFCRTILDVDYRPFEDASEGWDVAARAPVFFSDLGKWYTYQRDEALRLGKEFTHSAPIGGPWPSRAQIDEDRRQRVMIRMGIISADLEEEKTDTADTMVRGKDMRYLALRGMRHLTISDTPRSTCR